MCKRKWNGRKMRPPPAYPTLTTKVSSLRLKGAGVGGGWLSLSTPSTTDATARKKQYLNTYRERVCNNIEMTGIYHTILKCPDIMYSTEQVL